MDDLDVAGPLLAVAEVAPRRAWSAWCLRPWWRPLLGCAIGLTALVPFDANGALLDAPAPQRGAAIEADRRELLVEVESLRDARRQDVDLYTPPRDRGGTWVSPELPQLPTMAEAVLWAWLIDSEDVPSLTAELRGALATFNDQERTRRQEDARPLLMMGQDRAVLVEAGTDDYDGRRAFYRERNRLSAQFAAREDSFIRSIGERLSFDEHGIVRLERVIACRSIRRTFVAYVTVRPAEVDLMEALVTTDLDDPLAIVDAARFHLELDAAVASLASLRRRWEERRFHGFAEFRRRFREAQERGTMAPVHALRREVVAAEEAIIAATIDATEALVRQLDPASGHRLRTAVHWRLYPEVHPIPNDLALTRIELDAELAAGGPWNDDDAAIHARARTLLAEGAERQAHQANRMVAIVMNLRRAEGMQGIPLPALEAETLEQLESEREVLRSHATFMLDELLRLDQRLVNFPAIQRLREGLIDLPDEEDAGEHPDRSDESQ